LCCSVLQCVAVCCSVLQCVAVCYSVLQCVAVCYSVRQCVAVCYSVWQCVALSGGVWPCAAVCCSVLQYIAVCGSVLQCAAVCGSVQQCVAVCYSALQCAAVCCSVLQCAAAPCLIFFCTPHPKETHTTQETNFNIFHLKETHMYGKAFSDFLVYCSSKRNTQICVSFGLLLQKRHTLNIYCSCKRDPWFPCVYCIHKAETSEQCSLNNVPSAETSEQCRDMPYETHDFLVYIVYTSNILLIQKRHKRNTHNMYCSSSTRKSHKEISVIFSHWFPCVLLIQRKEITQGNQLLLQDTHTHTHTHTSNTSIAHPKETQPI